MTANKIYYPAFIGGKIAGVQLTIQNKGLNTASPSASNGVYYTFDGRDYQILSLAGVSIASGTTSVIAEDKVQYLTPTTDVKIMVDSAGLEDCVLNCQITWEVL